MRIILTVLVLLATVILVRQPGEPAKPVDCHFTFLQMEDMKQQIVHYRHKIDLYRSWAPAEAAWCERIMDQIDAEAESIERRAALGQPSNLDALQTLLDRFHEAGLAFKKEALQ